MAYARFSQESDVYVFSSGTEENPNVVCCGCRLQDEAAGLFVATSYDALLAHLSKHEKVGHKVARAVEVLADLEQRAEIECWLREGRDYWSRVDEADVP